MTVLEIVEAYLAASGFDGLYFDSECACLRGDLAPCGSIQENCKAGYKAPCDCGDEHQFHVQKEPPR